MERARSPRGGRPPPTQEEAAPASTPGATTASPATPAAATAAAAAATATVPTSGFGRLPVHELARATGSTVENIYDQYFPSGSSGAAAAATAASRLPVPVIASRLGPPGDAPDRPLPPLPSVRRNAHQAAAPAPSTSTVSTQLLLDGSGRGGLGGGSDVISTIGADYGSSSAPAVGHPDIFYSSDGVEDENVLYQGQHQPGELEEGPTRESGFYSPESEVSDPFDLDCAEWLAPPVDLDGQEDEEPDLPTLGRDREVSEALHRAVEEDRTGVVAPRSSLAMGPPSLLPLPDDVFLPINRDALYVDLGGFVDDGYPGDDFFSGEPSVRPARNDSVRSNNPYRNGLSSQIRRDSATLGHWHTDGNGPSRRTLGTHEEGGDWETNMSDNEPFGSNQAVATNSRLYFRFGTPRDQSAPRFEAGQPAVTSGAPSGAILPAQPSDVFPSAGRFLQHPAPSEALPDLASGPSSGPQRRRTLRDISRPVFLPEPREHRVNGLFQNSARMFGEPASGAGASGPCGVGSGAGEATSSQATNVGVLATVATSPAATATEAGATVATSSRADPDIERDGPFEDAPLGPATRSQFGFCFLSLAEAEERQSARRKTGEEDQTFLSQYSDRRESGALSSPLSRVFSHPPAPASPSVLSAPGGVTRPAPAHRRRSPNDFADFIAAESDRRLPAPPQPSFGDFSPLQLNRPARGPPLPRLVHLRTDADDAEGSGSSSSRARARRPAPRRGPSQGLIQQAFPSLRSGSHRLRGESIELDDLAALRQRAGTVSGHYHQHSLSLPHPTTTTTTTTAAAATTPHGAPTSAAYRA
ncbi:hypothetical protein B0T25DRAFT_616579 [Lasiosphaeria hispida]|uniref:Uncharacterized protein n=1 Tax=Lasiosphaeria hispida TaxID=260671 RepID=A0AAJ0H5X6_9PEZI|nr:hypothetical protein B0T25DRAFT_616579 [Lasiosphaeria hispida]